MLFVDVSLAEVIIIVLLLISDFWLHLYWLVRHQPVGRSQKSARFF